MDLFPIFKSIEQSGISVWIREADSLFAFWFILSIHAIGMGLLVGASVLIDLRLLGVAPDLPVAQVKRFYGFIWVGFWIQVVSGLLLLIAYPTKSLTNPDFYVKLGLIAVALVLMQKLRTRVLDDAALSETAMMAKGRALAIWTLVLWTAAVTAGRLLAYTYTNLTA